MKIHKELEQGSKEWREIRRTKLTASKANTIKTNGKGLKTCVYEKMAEYYSSAEPEDYTNKHIERGNELEPIALDMYEMKTGKEIEVVGFVEKSEYVGCSPDGLADDDGLAEVKCLSDKYHYKAIVNGAKEVRSKYRWQAQFQMMVCERDWCDIVYFNPNFEKDLLIFKEEKDEEMQEKLNKGIESGVKMIKEHLNR